ncbi:F-box and leucine-rich protein 22 isoform X2 [Esox lucius]|nr:F-box and leucine-rich protein 22 isoform X2 [Esox lucius]
MDPSNMDPSNMDPSNMDPSNMDPSNMDPSNMDPSNMDPSNMEHVEPSLKLSITQLNQECLLHLFSFLDKESRRSLSLTCCRLRDVYLDPCLWTLLQFHSPSELRRANYVLGPSLRRLDITWLSSRVKVCNVEDWLKTQFQKDLCSKHDTLVSKFLERVCSMCPNLQFLTLSGCGHISDQEVTRVLQCCSQLRCLRLENCVRVTDRTLQALVLHGAALHQFTVDFCRNVTQEGLLVVRERRPDIRLSAERSAGMIPDIKPDKKTQRPLRRTLLQKVLMFS